MSPRAAVLLRHGVNYRATVFADGLRRHGYQIDPKWSRNPRPDDLLVLWNRTRSFESVAQVYERHGARVVIAENGYLDRLAGAKTYALALTGHNGAGTWFIGDEPRFAIEEQPWRTDGSKVLVLPQRGIGTLRVAMPTGWQKSVMERLERMTKRPLVLRKHPGHQKVEQPLDFADVWCAVTWGSGAGIKALRAGVPVFHGLPCWIGSPGAALLADDLEACQTSDRAELWRRITWAQWTLDEIGSGEAFDRLLNEEDRRLFRSEQSPLADHRQGDGARRRESGRIRGPAQLA